MTFNDGAGARGAAARSAIAAGALALGAAAVAQAAGGSLRRRGRTPRAAATLTPRSGPPAAADLILGCSALAGMYEPIGAAAASAAVVYAIERGIKDFDTAPHYGLGLSEERLGAGLVAANAANDPTVRVWSKVGRLVRPLADLKPGDVIETGNMAGEPTCIFPETRKQIAPVLDYTAAGVRASREDTRERLGPAADRLHGLRVHDCDEPERYAQAMARGGGVDGLVQLRNEGLIDSVSVGLNDPECVLRMVRARPAGTFDSVMVAGAWNLIDQDALPLLLECQRRGIAVHNAGCFASGILVGGSSYKYGAPPPEVRAKVEAWTALAEQHATPLPVLAIAFALLPAVVTRLAVGVKSAEEIKQNLEWVQQAGKVPAALWHEAKAQGLLAPEVDLPPMQA